MDRRDHFEVDHDSQPTGMQTFKRHSKNLMQNEVSKRLTELQTTFREREDLIQQLMHEEEQESFNRILKHEGDSARFK